MPKLPKSYYPELASDYKYVLTFRMKDGSIKFVGKPTISSLGVSRAKHFDKEEDAAAFVNKIFVENGKKPPNPINIDEYKYKKLLVKRGAIYEATMQHLKNVISMGKVNIEVLKGSIDSCLEQAKEIESKLFKPA